MSLWDALQKGDAWHPTAKIKVSCRQWESGWAYFVETNSGTRHFETITIADRFTGFLPGWQSVKKGHWDVVAR